MEEEIGDVCQVSRRFKERTMEEGAYKKAFSKIMKGLNLSNVET